MEEARRRYDEERDCRKSLETKTGSLIAANSIIIALTPSVSSMKGYQSFFILGTALMSLFLCLHILFARKYEKSSSAEDIKEQILKSGFNHKMNKEVFFESYLGSVEKNSGINDSKYNFFIASSVLTAISLFIVFLSAAFNI